MNRRERDGFDDLPILADLRELLADHMHAAGAQGAGAPARRPRPGGWALNGARRAGLALAVAVALAVVAVGLVALHQRTAGRHTTPPASGGNVHRTTPPVNPAPSPGSKLATTAQHQVIAHDHACSQPTNRGQTIDHGSPGHAVLSLLGVLRRPALPADPTNRVLHSIGWDIGAGVYVNYIRRARTEYGRSYWIVPEARTTPFGPIPARCYREFHATLVRDLRHASPALQAQALRAQRDQLDIMRSQSEHRAGICFIEIGLHVRPHPGAVGFGCDPGVQGVVPGSGGNGSGYHGGGTILSGMAPDGIVAVTAHYPASASDPARTITSNVVNNVYVIKVPPNTSRPAVDAVWSVKMSDGRVLTPQQLHVNLGLPGGGGG
jgi:hypothetical protein